MAQFTIYTSSDTGGPGPITGQAGSILTVFDACLVNGYTGHAAAGWTKPFANSSNSGCYKQGSGAGFAFHVQDNGGNVTSTFKEAWATGWETITAVNATNGTGSGQFPLPTQNSGHVVIPKSNTADGTARPWIIFADSATVYLFVMTGAVGAAALVYCNFRFGDVYSFRGSSDAFRCMIHSQASENSLASAGRTIDNTDRQNSTTAGAANGSGFYVARPGGGAAGGASTVCLQIGDMTKGGATAEGAALLGSIPTPNAYDNSFYLCPLQICEATSQMIRGRIRGLYHVCHPLANFADGQTFQGSNDLAGKTFMIVWQSRAGGYWAVEISNTLDTN